ncbi:hypothetical protein [Streptomyces sp. RKAG293]|uniref:hypothetical protein n=1 Tax=Streptomyces sp. RKAG293 TaxID=2893403 RepID=UPI002033D92F|nr:hypothetical protein [Streptomyces sp. RKAG293]MCM2420310.1 hypothetical protein [Streptomyces sp. RKAG293]
MPFTVWQPGMKITAGLLTAMQPPFAYKTADKAVPGAVLQPDNHLTLPAEAGAIYVLQGHIQYTQNMATGAANSGVRIGWLTTAGAVLNWTSRGAANITSGTTYETVLTANGAARDFPANSGTVMTLSPTGTLATGASPATLTLQFGVTNAAGLPATVKAGSWISITRMQ